MTNIIITEPSRNLRMLGRQALSGRWKQAITAALIYQICITLPALILDELFGKTFGELYGNLYYDSPNGFGAHLISRFSESAQKISAMSGLYEFLVTGAFTLGIAIFFIHLFRREETDSAQVFCGFEYFFKSVGLVFIMGLFVFLWSLLFIVPGIIAALRYSQAFLILADNPQKGVFQCLNESKLLMKGNKGKYFCLQLSFIGWILLTMIVVLWLSSRCTAVLGFGFLSTILSWIFSLAMSWITAYMMASEVAFYDILTGKLRANAYIPGQQ